MVSWCAKSLKQGKMRNSWLGVIVNGMWKANNRATMNTERQMGRDGQKNLKQGIESNSWLAVLGDGKQE